MFEDCSFNAVSFKSEVKQTRQSTDGDTQTTPCSVQDAAEQSREFSSKMVQTEEIQPKANVQYDEIKLSEFLKMKYPILIKELNYPSPLLGKIEDDDNDFSEKSKKLHEIKSPFKLSRGEYVRVSASVWKKDSNIVCFGYSYDHEDWCCHTSMVHIYSLNIANNSQGVTPKVLETPSCITSLQYHPHLPTILAGAMFNGEIIVWDLHREEPVITSSASHNKQGNGHKDAISQISWIRNVDINQEQPMLVTAGSDGLMILWHFSPFSCDLSMFARFLLKPPPAIPNKSARNLMYGLYEVDLGVTSFSFSPRDPKSFIIGMDSGDILKCEITDMYIKQAEREMHILELCPVTGYYERHNASVTDVKHMKHESGRLQKFITSGVDKVIKIFEENQDIPLCIFHCEEVVMGLTFCDIEERVLLAWGSQKLHFFDIYTQELIESPVLGSELRNVRNTSVSSNRDDNYNGDGAMVEREAGEIEEPQ
ncbi:WD repeat-containing protein 34 [Gryllus bimaculatus]|nr:WD repeat-containing protein 34 [Gryllus bimaculatus]